MFADERMRLIAAGHVLLPNTLPITRFAIVRVNDASATRRLNRPPIFSPLLPSVRGVNIENLI
jgi:hypothetical protein